MLGWLKVQEWESVLVEATALMMGRQWALQTACMTGLMRVQESAQQLGPALDFE